MQNHTWSLQADAQYALSNVWLDIPENMGYKKFIFKKIKHFQPKDAYVENCRFSNIILNSKLSIFWEMFQLGKPKLEDTKFYKVTRLYMKTLAIQSQTKEMLEDKIWPDTNSK